MSAAETHHVPDAPDTALPAGACDCHVHVIGTPEAYPMVAQRHYTPGPASLDALRRHLSGLGLQRAVIVQPSVYGTDNRCTLDSLERLDGAARGVVVPPEDVAPDALRRMHARGARGVRINLESAGRQDAAALDDCWRGGARASRTSDGTCSSMPLRASSGSWPTGWPPCR